MKLSIAFTSAFCTLVLAVPTWDSASTLGRTSSLMAAADSVVAISPQIGLHPQRKYLVSTGEPGTEGSAFVMHHPSPPMFIISPPNGGSLYQLINETTVMHVNIMNQTDVPGSPLPFKVTIGPKKDGVLDGWWAWAGTRLGYHHGSNHNSGLFYECTDTSGTTLYIALGFVQTPPGCFMTTLHSLSRAITI